MCTRMQWMAAKESPNGHIAPWMATAFCSNPPPNFGVATLGAPARLGKWLAVDKRQRDTFPNYHARWPG